MSKSYPEQQEELGWLRRPARRQVDESTIKKCGGGDGARSHGSHNIWSGHSLDKPAGPDRPTLTREKKERSLYRCRPELDVGKTRGSEAHQRTFCLYFAKRVQRKRVRHGGALCQPFFCIIVSDGHAGVGGSACPRLVLILFLHACMRTQGVLRPGIGVCVPSQGAHRRRRRLSHKDDGWVA
jgi:hypothetical protein